MTGPNRFEGGRNMKTKHRIHRAVSVLLALVMVLTMAPATALSAAALEFAPVVVIEDPTVLIEAEITDDPQVVIYTTINDNNPRIVIEAHVNEPEWSYPPEAYDTSWSGLGTEENPFIIKTGSGLDLLSKLVSIGVTFNGAYFALQSDITVGNVCSEEFGNWTPIGDCYHPFAGKFDGRGYTISDLYIGGGDYQGLFGVLTGTVSNLNVSGSVYGGERCGGVVSDNNGVISNCTFAGSITGTVKFVGGIAGFNNGTIEDCTNYAEVCSPGEQGGGIAGLQYSGSITDCVNRGKIISAYSDGGAFGGSDSGDGGTGGIAGIATGGTLSDCQNYGYMVYGKHVGGIVGQTRIPISNCENYGNINLYQSRGPVGGIVGSNPVSNADISDCTNYGDLNYKNFATDVGGIIGENGRSKVLRCVNEGHITGCKEVGGIAGYSDGRIADCVNNGAVEGNNYGNQCFTGGIAGRAGEITRCLNTGYVAAYGVNSSNNQGVDAGGIVGDMESNGGGVSYCVNTGHVMSYDETGGIAGRLVNYATIRNCYNTGRISTTTDNDGDEGIEVGGIVGYSWNAYIYDCFNTGSVEGREYIGGIVGFTYHASVKNCYSCGAVKGDKNVGGVIGRRWVENASLATNLLERNYYYSEDEDLEPVGYSTDTIFADEISRMTEHELRYGGPETYVNWDFDTNWYMTDNGPRLYGVSVGAPSGVYPVNNVKDLKKLRDLINTGIEYRGVDVQLMCDLDLSGESNWEPIGGTARNEYAAFYGVFNGNQHTISGLTIDDDEENLGLFGVVEGTIKDLRVEGSVEGYSPVGGIAAVLDGGTIENCSFIGTVKGTAVVGGIVGVIRLGAEMRGCTCAADVTGSASLTSSGNESYVGGLAGMAFNNCLIEACAFDGGTVSGGSCTGGLVGHISNATMRNCFHFGDVNGHDGSNVGGVVGRAVFSGAVATCAHYTGAVSGYQYVGGVAGYAIKETAAGSMPAYTLNDNFYLSGTVTCHDSLGNADVTDRGIGEQASGGLMPDILLEPNPSGVAEPLPESEFRVWSNFRHWDDTVWAMAADHPVLRNIYETVTFHANGGDGTMNDFAIPAFGGALPACAFTKSGEAFILWNTAADGSGDCYLPGDKVPGDQSIDLYAIWAKKENVTYVDTNGQQKTAANCVGLNTSLSQLRTGWYFSDGIITYDRRVEVDGDVNLILTDTTGLYVLAGIHVPNGSSLTIWGQAGAYAVPDSDAVTQGKGTMEVRNILPGSGLDFDNCAALGGNAGEVPGAIAINGGVIKALAGNGAAIGSGRGSNANEVIIRNACVTARSMGGSAAIGGGTNGNGGRVEIIDSYVSAVGGTVVSNNKTYASPGIGAGAKGNTVESVSATVGIINSWVHAEAGDASDAGENGVAARAIGSSKLADFDLGWIYPISHVRAVDENDAPVTQDLIPYMCTRQSVDLKPCTFHVGCADNLQKCRYCGVTSASGVHFVVCDYNYNNSPAPFSYGTEDGGSFEISDHIIGAQNAEFRCWSTNQDGSGTKYYPGNSITPTGELTLYAQWSTKKPVVYVDENGSQQTATATVLTQADTALSAGWYVAEGALTFSDRITVSGDVHLILADGCDLVANTGVCVPEDASLTIYGQTARNASTQTVGTGVLSAQSGSSQHAAIGGNRSGTAGTITVNGGIVVAQGNYGAGIGGGDVGTCGTVNVNEGLVVAYGGNGSAGIGGGGYSSGGTVNIRGGFVVATGSVYSDTNQAAPAIGSGRPRANGSQPLLPGRVTVTGGTVVAMAGVVAGNGTGAQAIGVNLADAVNVPWNSLSIATGMRVTAGNTEDTAELSLYANRVAACRMQFAKIEPCATHTPSIDNEPPCIHCGLNYEVPPAPPAPPVVTAHSLSLNGDIGVNFYAEVPQATADVYASFTVDGKTVDVPIDLEKFLMSGETKQYKFTCSVAAAQIDTPIVGKIVNGVTESEAFTYSVQTYLTEAQQTQSEDAEFMALAGSLATYGYYANELFGYNDAFAQHTLFDDSGFTTVTAASIADYEEEMLNEENAVTYVGSSLVLRTETAIRHYFLLPEGKTVDDFYFYCWDPDNDRIDLTPVENGAYYYVEVPNIESANLSSI